MTGQFARREVSISWSSVRRRVRGDGMFERALCEEAGLLPLGDPIDMVLQVDDAEEEGHYAAECERDVFLRVVIVLHRSPNFEDTDDVRNHARKDKQEAESGNTLVTSGCARADGEDAGNESGRVHPDQDEGGIIADQTAGPIGENYAPDRYEQN